ncbi:2-oxo-4-hydroxy-4-carboxy-5-ureidoimidazoline decarboxylase-like isoform X2 [Mercenaria mercenaria]|nr:2-oxo-4-hydroxy-4-carboxy-5-ureidoimidazoline decarboxylase-like isoform X2 [Mercenaria mercenaria]XP_045162266.1 2-oxo-4-hydroxy-4-carboxy-5-ureidoimidazoline decarboxylase-like isoform X2 [Mercenaria mercenaria]XP_045162267.1 2-oxo-4-hydroxy-4-carboxy-5-ureidoimidazoline decarboxylase-like isoform X2 [Mercenaria mercenaria]
MTEEKRKRNISEVNSLAYDDFIAIFGNVVEHCALCAAVVWGDRPFRNYGEMQSKFNEFIEQLPLSGKSGVLRLYPDLAGKLAQSNSLTSESTREHASAGLDKMTEEEREKMSKLNTKYREKFGFPFVICARENKKEAILFGLERRLNNSVEVEANTGTNEVKKICNLRLKDLVDEHSVAKL